MVEPGAHAAIAAHEVGFLHLLQLADHGNAALGEFLLHRLADTPDESHRLLREEAQRFGAAKNREATWLLEVGGKFREELVVRQAGGGGDAYCRLNPGEEAGKGQRRAHAVEARRACEVEEGLVDGEGLHQRRHLQHQIAYDFARRRVFCHVGLDDHRLRAKLQGLEHRHGGLHAMDARDVAGGGDDTTRAAAHNHRLVRKFWPVALLDRGIESIAIDMGDRKRVKFRMADQPRAAAGAAAPLITRSGCKAIAAKARRCGIPIHALDTSVARRNGEHWQPGRFAGGRERCTSSIT